MNEGRLGLVDLDVGTCASILFLILFNGIIDVGIGQTTLDGYPWKWQVEVEFQRVDTVSSVKTLFSL